MVFNKKLNVPKPVPNEYHEPIIHTQPKVNDLDLGGLDFRDTQKRPQRQPVFERPVSEDFMQEPHHKRMVKGNTLFVKIDTYKESMKTLNLLKESLMNTEHILEKLHKIKDQEDSEIRAWHSEIKRMKQKIMFVDKNLFEHE